MHDEYRFLIDCGEGTQRQILQSGIGFKRLNRILITHGHLDHILGLAGLLSTFMRWETIEELEIYGGQWALDRVHDLIYGIVLRGAKPPMDLQLLQIQPGVIFAEGDFTITAFPVWHRGPDCFGYLFEEKPRRPFLPEKAEALNIPRVPGGATWWTGKPVTLPDGRTIQPDQVLGPPAPGHAPGAHRRCRPHRRAGAKSARARTPWSSKPPTCRKKPKWPSTLPT